jgi:HD-GYP domain-containing protein (c-di-GMP phosphodiesterase class II)
MNAPPVNASSLETTSQTGVAGVPPARFEGSHPVVAEGDVCVEERVAKDEALEEKRRYKTATERLKYLNQINLALSSERDIERLLDLILTAARDLTDADGGSLYILEKSRNAAGEEEKTLFFRHSQNASVTLDAKGGNFAVTANSLAGYAALSGETINCEDAYELPADAPYGFNRSWDEKHGYRTKSVLNVPMKNPAGEVTGVLQLINRKHDEDARLSKPEDFEAQVLPFDDDSAEVAAVLASQAAVALENNMLLQEVTKLLSELENTFESYVRASASLIDDRDPPTSGHSNRVTFWSIAMAEEATYATEGPFADIRFSEKELKELHYAGLLHDIGKIGVREYIFTKSHKITPSHFEGVLSRLEMRRRDRESDALRRKLAILQTHGWESAAPLLAQVDEETAAEFAQLEKDIQILRRANDPSVTFMPDDEFEEQQQVLHRIASQTYCDLNGTELPMLSSEELEALSVRRGSLTPAERKHMEEHAQMSYDFLRQISWTEPFRNIPNIAHCHHEKLNGKGYPRGIKAEEIPLQSRMMTVADIFDALTAADRPYKKAMPLDRAIKILQEEAARGDLDADVVDLFVNNVLPKYSAPLRATMDPNEGGVKN